MIKTYVMSQKRKAAKAPPLADFTYTFHLSRRGKFVCDWSAGPFTEITGHSAAVLHQHGWETLIYPKDKPLLKERPVKLLAGHRRGGVRHHDQR